MGSAPSPQPPLQPEFPTYGKLLREVGYDTPYIGKWHLSDSPPSPSSPIAGLYLDEYGFQGLTWVLFLDTATTLILKVGAP